MSNLSGIIKGICPNCGKSHIFETKGNPFLLKMPKMREKCDVCDYSYHKEPGFYFGAMYVSYGFVVIQLILVMIIGFLFSLSYMQMFISTLIFTFILWTFNYKYARIIWLYIFK